VSKLRLIQCGVGGMGNAWWRGPSGKSPDFDLVAIVDIADAPLNECGDTLGIPPERRFKSLEAALEKVEADAILTVTPPVIHAKHAELAFSRGLHVLTEKPIADNLENARRMVEQAEKAGRILHVAQNYRYTPPVQRLKALLAEKPVGAFGHGHLDFYIGADFTGTFRETMEFPLLVDMAIHHIDLIRCITGRNVRKVTALSFKPSWSTWYRHDPGLKMLLQLDDGTAFSYSGDWSALGEQTPWNGNWRLQCAEGALIMKDDHITLTRCQKWGTEPSYWPQHVGDIPLRAQAKLLHDFAEAIRTGKQPETSGQDNLWSFGAVMAGVISAREGRTVDVQELIGR
jgi:predicted dehydrogenase